MAGVGDFTTTLWPIVRARPAQSVYPTPQTPVPQGNQYTRGGNLMSQMPFIVFVVLVVFVAQQITLLE